MPALKRLMVALFATLVIVGNVPPAAASAAMAPVPAPISAGPRAMTAADVETWLDGLMPSALRRGDVAGAVVVIVKDGQILAQKGYGYADVATRRPVDPLRTMFRAGSTSKLFTWTAVMQLVERGQLDLDTDVNVYLDFKLRPYDGKPVTLRQIMTHTAGFEEMLKGLIFSNPKRISPLGDAVKQQIPRRIFAPGTTPAYSNYATGLAGYIVERRSGLSFDDYVERHIFGPLQMARASFRQPLPFRYMPFLSSGYDLASAPPKPYEFIRYAPAGSLTVTGADMAKFLIAHLNGGGGLLRPETLRQMHETKLTIMPALNRMALGFYEQNINGRIAIAHGGDTQWFHSDLWLFPAEKVGAFISFNSNGANGAASDIRAAFFEQFADRYLPELRPAGRISAAAAAEHARAMVGSYMPSRRVDGNFLRLMELGRSLSISLDDRGGLVIPAIVGLDGAPRRWVEIAPFVWREVDGHERLAAQVVDGKVVRVSVDSLSPYMVFDRTPWHRLTSWIALPLLISLIVILLTALSWPAAALVRRHYGAKPVLTGVARRFHRLTRLLCFAVLAVILAWVILAGTMISDLEKLDGRFDTLVLILQIIGLDVIAGLVIAAVLEARSIWRDGRAWPVKLWNGAIIVAAGLILWATIIFKLVSFPPLF